MKQETIGPFRSSRLVLATLVAGTLDILSACVYAMIAGRTPLQMLTGVGRALLGNDAQGAALPFVGLATHYAIMAVIVLVYAVVARRLPILSQRWLAAGILYGLATWAVMNLVVLPLRFPGILSRFTVLAVGEQLLSHVVLVGLPIALLLRGAPAGVTSPARR
jgi:hypothetical protein